MFISAVPAAGGVNLSGGWSTAWGGISGAVPGLTGILTTVGVILVSYALVKFAWDRKRGAGGGGGGNSLPWFLVIGAICAGPAIVMPILLKLADFAINGVVGLFNTF